MKRWWWLILLLGMFWPGQLVAAEGAGFTVTPELPANQIGGDTGWFNLLVKPGETQTLTVTVANQSNQDKQLKLELTNAFTQDNGQVGYAPNQKKATSAKLQLTAIGSRPISLTLAAHQGRKVTFQVKPPAKGFSGQILGAVYVRDETPPAEASGSGFAVTNAFAMVVAVQLQTSEKLVPPAVQLDAVKATTEHIQATLQNTAPRLFGKMTLQAKVLPAGQTTAVYTQKNTDYAMAPTSAFNYQLTPTKTLAAGEYQLVIDASAGSYKWHLTKNFTLKQAIAAAPAPAPKVNPPVWWPWVVALVAVLLLGIGLGWWRGRKRRG